MDHNAEIGSLLADSVLDGGAADSTDSPMLPDTVDGGALPQVAFALWAYEAGRDMARTQQLLVERTGMTVALDQLRAWRVSGRWGDIFTTVHQALIGTSAYASKAMFEKAQLDAAAVMIEIMKDPTANPATRLKAAAMVADRGGNPQQLRTESIGAVHLASSSEYDGVSSDELEAEYSTFNADDYEGSRQRKADAMTTQYTTASLTH